MAIKFGPNLATPTDILVFKTDLALDQVSNTSDLAKPVSTATQTAINYGIGSISKVTLGLDQVDNTSDVNKPVSTSQAAAISTAIAGVTPASIGLDQVNNTSDANKPVSTAQQAALDLKTDERDPTLVPTIDYGSSAPIETTTQRVIGSIRFNTNPQPGQSLTTGGNAGWIQTASGWFGFGVISAT